MDSGDIFPSFSPNYPLSRSHTHDVSLISYAGFFRLDYPLRSISFSADSRLIATASEDHSIDIAWAETGAR